MKRVLLPLSACLFLTFVLSDHAAARKKKKPKPPKTRIAECGELIFEDDFDGKQLDTGWTGAIGGAKSAKGKLQWSVNTQEVNPPGIVRKLPLRDFVLEAVVAMPAGTEPSCWAVQFRNTEKGFLSPLMSLSQRSQISIYANPPGGKVGNASLQLAPVRKPIYVFVFERVGPDICLQVNRDVVRVQVPELPEEFAELMLQLKGKTTVAVDYIRVWHAKPRKGKRGR